MVGFRSRETTRGAELSLLSAGQKDWEKGVGNAGSKGHHRTCSFTREQNFSDLVALLVCYVHSKLSG